MRPAGAYWGAGGEQIDLYSGNLNYTLPLLKAAGRGSWAVTFSLSYNSQLWRKDPGGTWKLGRDVGYGFGWRLQAGSITPYWSDSFTIHHYTFIGSTGAEYRLDRNTNGIWSSSESIYLKFDPITSRLYFPDGSFWLIGCLSTGNEEDAGSRYPTMMQDTNGNRVLIRYGGGVGLWWTNSSARITEIEDVRATQGPSSYRSYTFTYNTDTIPHLTRVDSTIDGLTKRYDFTYLANQTLSSPFSPPVAFGTTTLLQTVTDPNLWLTHQFSYGSNNAGQLTQVDLPYGGHLRWDHYNYTYTDSQTHPEVQYRYLAKAAGAPETTYTLGRDGGDTYHGHAYLSGPAGVGSINWTFMACGLVSNKWTYTDQGVAKLHHEYGWSSDSQGNGYISSVTTTHDTWQTYEKQFKTEQTLDIHGNVTQRKIYDFGNLTTPVRTYNYTYLTDSNYTSRHIRNRLATGELSVPGATITLVTNTYDSTSLTNRTGLREHDTANYGTGFPYRGNVTRRVANTLTTNLYYDIGGAVTSADDNNGYTVAVTPDAGKNYAAPSVVTPNSVSDLAESYTWTGFLGLATETGPNSATASVSYDAQGRPSSSISPHGATTTYEYQTAAPAWTKATTNGRWVKTTYDGLGRTVKTETGHGTTTVSIVETEYDSCACSPLGKVKRASLPYAPGGTVYWTTYSYDCLGRTLSVTAPDASATSYVYEGNTVKVTDPRENGRSTPWTRWVI